MVTLAGNLNFIDFRNFLFSHEMILQKFELWRVLTCFLYAGPFSIPMVLTMYMLLTNSQAYEQGGPFNTGAGGGTADYVTALLFAVVIILTIQIFIYPMMPLFTQTLVFFVLYLWSRRNPTVDVKIYGVVPTKAVYMPFFYLGLAIVIGGDPLPMMEACAIGHLYYFLVDVVPDVYGKTIIQTPQFLIDQFGMGIYQREAAVPAQPAAAGPRTGTIRPAAGAATGGTARPATTGGGYNWGTGGRPLGRGD